MALESENRLNEHPLLLNERVDRDKNRINATNEKSPFIGWDRVLFPCSNCNGKAFSLAHFPCTRPPMPPKEVFIIPF